MSGPYCCITHCYTQQVHNTVRTDTSARPIRTELDELMLDSGASFSATGDARVLRDVVPIMDPVKIANGQQFHMASLGTMDCLVSAIPKPLQHLRLGDALTQTKLVQSR